MYSKQRIAMSKVHQLQREPPMNTFRTLVCIVGLVTLSGCAEMGQLLRETSEFQAQQPPQRNYFTQPFTPLPGYQPSNPSPANAPQERYQTIMVNTPQGIVYKRCKVLNGAVACF